MRPVPAGGAGLGRGVASAGTSTQHQSRTLYWTSSSVPVMQEVKASQLCDQLHRSSRTEVGCGLRRHIYPTPVTLLILQLDQFILAVVRQCNKHHWSGVCVCYDECDNHAVTQTVFSVNNENFRCRTRTPARFGAGAGAGPEAEAGFLTTVILSNAG